jgi:prophage maintenance system killer protein
MGSFGSSQISNMIKNRKKHVAQGGLETSFGEGGNISFSLHELHKLMNVNVNKRTSLASFLDFS